MYQNVRISSRKGGMSFLMTRSLACQMMLRMSRATLIGYSSAPFEKFLISHSLG